MKEAVDQLVTRSDGIYIDGTVGAAGHAEAILKRLGNQGRFLGIDRDPEILETAQKRLQLFGNRCLLLHGSYENLEGACRLLGVSQVDGCLLDLGLSSLQLEQAERGFSFAKEAALDMRMDPTGGETAQEIVERVSLKELEGIFKNFGEERFASSIAREIIEERRTKNIRTTKDLAEIVCRAIPRRAWPRRIHPATRTFQALRIAVNRELDRLKVFLEKAPNFIVPGGRVVILSYHSLEDRMVKRAFLDWERKGLFKRITRKPVRPSEEEIRENPRARSAKMRVAEKQ